MESGFDALVLYLDIGYEFVESHADGFLACGIHTEHGMCGAGNGIAEVASVDFGQRHFVLEAESVEEPGQQFVGIGTAEVDIASGVSSEAAADFKTEEMEIGGGEGAFVVECAGGVHTAGASHEYLGIVFGIEVQQYGTFDHSFSEVVGAGEACLFVDGEERFERAMHQILVD